MTLKTYTGIVLLSLIFSCTVSMNKNKPLAYISETDTVIETRRFNFSTHNNFIETEFLYPKKTNYVVGKFEKMEIGAVLPPDINDMIDEFLNNSTATYPNPYDPEHINMEAIFVHGKDTLKGFGFYYMDYDRNLQKNDAWKEKRTDYNWRVRFAPNDTGKWTCSIRVKFPNSNIETSYSKNIEFTCIDKSKTGFITISEDKRHFKFADNDQQFFSIGQNIAWTEAPVFKGRWINGDSEFNFKNKDFNKRLYHIGFTDAGDFIKNVSSNNGNLVRIVSWQDSYLFEWEEPGFC